MPQHLAGVYEHQWSCVSSQRGREENASAQFTRCMSFHYHAAHQSDLTQLCCIVLKPFMYSFLELMEDVSACDGKPAFIHVLHSLSGCGVISHINQLRLQMHFLSIIFIFYLFIIIFCKIKSDFCLYTNSATSIWGCCCSELALGFCFFLLKIHQDAQTNSSHTQLMSLMQETHHFYKLLLNKLHSCLVHS